MKNEIIERIYLKHIPEKTCQAINRLKCQEDREDYCQDMYLILLETPLEKLQKLDEEGKLADYFARICINQLVNQKSVTHKKLETYIQKISLDNYETDRQRETQECS